MMMNLQQASSTRGVLLWDKLLTCILSAFGCEAVVRKPRNETKFQRTFQPSVECRHYLALSLSEECQLGLPRTRQGTKYTSSDCSHHSPLGIAWDCSSK